MILENFKKDKVFILRVLMGVIFLAAALFKLLNPVAASQELSGLNLPQIFFWPFFIIEIVGGLCLLINFRVKLVSVFLGLFLLGALLLGLIVNGNEILRQAAGLFVFRAEATDWFLHFVFLVVIFYVFIVSRK